MKKDLERALDLRREVSEHRANAENELFQLQSKLDAIANILENILFRLEKEEKK